MPRTPTRIGVIGCGVISGIYVENAKKLDAIECVAVADVNLEAAQFRASQYGVPKACSPEELLAAAHASCFCMALSSGLAKGGNAPERLEASATVTFVPGEGVKSSKIDVSGRVPGLDQAGFEEAARGAGQNCPISQALKGNVEITVEATIES